jgi:PKD repeat protein
VSRHLPFIGLAIAAVLTTSCDKVPLLAPSQSTITLTTSTTSVPVNGVVEVSASVTEPSGTPVQNGTYVTFTSSFGTIEPQEARTTGGRATVQFKAGTQSGKAQIGAFSGASRATAVEILVGGAAAARVLLRADPQSVPATGGTTTVAATVVDGSGNTLSGVPVTFTANAGQLLPGQVVTDITGEARTTLSTPRSTTVTATAGGQSGTVEVTATSPAVTITAPANIEAGTPVTFTVAPVVAAGSNPIRSVTIDFGDGATPLVLGQVTGSTPVAKVFARAGIYTIRATVVDTAGITGTSTIVVSVSAQAGIVITLAATPNPVSISSPAQAGVVSFVATTGVLGGGGAAVQAYFWSFGDGGSATTTGSAATYRYSSPGVYTARVTVRSTNGGEGVAILVIRVTD